MKQPYMRLFSIILICLISSCGGTIGNIEKYRFYNVSMDSLKAAVKVVNLKHPEFNQYDTIKFEVGKSKYVDNADYYCAINKDNTKYFFVYAFIQYDKLNNSFTDISLSSAAPYGKDLMLAKDIGYFDQKKYKELFDEYFIKEVKQELKYTKSNSY